MGTSASQLEEARPSRAAAPDAESQRWLARLRADSPDREAAAKELHVLLLRAARFELRRRGATLAHLNGRDHDDLAQQSADDALVALLGKLDSFRGESRFTTWAYKFALYEAAVKARRRAWRERELTLEPERWPQLADSRADAAGGAETRELLAAVQRAIAEELTPHQRTVLVAVTLQDVPIDVLAERLQSTRGALYKTLHDARRKLRARLREQGLEPEGAPGGGSR